MDAVIKAMEEFCVGQTNEIYERFTFNKRDQEPNETIDAYVAMLQTLARTCKYEALEDEMIRDQIVLGIRDNSTCKKLLQEKKLDLQICIDICRANEKTASQLKDTEGVQFVKSMPFKGTYLKGKGQRNQSTSGNNVKYDNDQPRLTHIVETIMYQRKKNVQPMEISAKPVEMLTILQKCVDPQESGVVKSMFMKCTRVRTVTWMNHHQKSLF